MSTTPLRSRLVKMGTLIRFMYQVHIGILIGVCGGKL